MRLFNYIFLFLFFIYACKNKCVHNVYIYNDTNQSIIFAQVLGPYPNNCSLEEDEIKPNQYHTEYRRCWKKELPSGRTFDFYLIDTAGYLSNIKYVCDSIELKNKILKRYSLTLDDLKKSNYTVHYP